MVERCDEIGSPRELRGLHRPKLVARNRALDSRRQWAMCLLDGEIHRQGGGSGAVLSRDLECPADQLVADERTRRIVNCDPLYVFRHALEARANALRAMLAAGAELDPLALPELRRRNGVANLLKPRCGNHDYRNVFTRQELRERVRDQRFSRERFEQLVAAEARRMPG